MTEPLQAITGVQNRVWPEEKNIAFDNFITGILSPNSSNGQCNFKFAISGASTWKASVALALKDLSNHEPDEVARIVVWWQ